MSEETIYVASLSEITAIFADLCLSWNHKINMNTWDRGEMTKNCNCTHDLATILSYYNLSKFKMIWDI